VSRIVIATPWGDSETLRERMLSPGPGNTPEEVEENQRQRLFGAMVASVSLRGYENTRVSDLAELSGVSTRSFYELFSDKRACFLAAVKTILAGTVSQMYEGPGRATGFEGAKWRVETFLELVATQPAAARMCLVEAYAAGPQAAALVDEMTERAESLIRQRLFGAEEEAEMLPELLTAGIASVLEIVRLRLLRDRAARLPHLADGLIAFLLAHEPPVRPLRTAARPPSPRPEELEAGDHAERAMRAFELLLVDTPYGEITMEQVAKCATMSVRTLYANFAGREELMLATVDSACAQTLAVMLPAYRRARSHPEGVRAALGALFGLLASRPNLAHLLLIGLHEGGGKALSMRMEALQPLSTLLTGTEGTHLSAVPRLSIEAFVGAVLGLSRVRMLEAGAAALPSLTPLCTYLTLAPVLGAEDATAAAEGKSYRRPPRDHKPPLRALRNPAGDDVLLALSGGPMTPGELARETALETKQIWVRIKALQAAGLVELLDEGTSGEEALVRSKWAVEPTEEGAGREQGHREQISAAIRGIIAREIQDAVDAGTFDARPERHLTRIVTWTDEAGWRELSQILDETLDQCLAAKKRIGQRLRRKQGDVEPFRASINITAFEVPKPEEL